VYSQTWENPSLLSLSCILLLYVRGKRKSAPATLGASTRKIAFYDFFEVRVDYRTCATDDNDSNYDSCFLRLLAYMMC